MINKVKRSYREKLNIFVIERYQMLIKYNYVEQLRRLVTSCHCPLKKGSPQNQFFLEHSIKTIFSFLSTS